jgi:hypothetical protein
MATRACAVLAGLLATSIGGCAVPVVTKVDRNARFDSASPDAMVVFGFSARLNVWLFPGIDDGVSWRCASGRANARRIRPDDGFIVARLPAKTGKEKYGIGALGSDMNLEVRGPRANQGVWVFNAEPGKVTYLGAYRVAWSDGYPEIVEDRSVKQSDADDYLTRTFPNVPVHVAPGRMESAYMSFDRSNGCL